MFKQKDHAEMSEDFVVAVEFFLEKIFGFDNVEQILDEDQFRQFFKYCSAVLINDDEWDTFVSRCFPRVMQPDEFKRSKVSHVGFDDKKEVSYVERG